jgi:hypothetical protein
MKPYLAGFHGMSAVRRPYKEIARSMSKNEFGNYRHIGLHMFETFYGAENPTAVKKRFALDTS